jgi:hypothetical protein
MLCSVRLFMGGAVHEAANAALRRARPIKHLEPRDRAHAVVALMVTGARARLA